MNKESFDFIFSIQYNNIKEELEYLIDNKNCCQDYLKECIKCVKEYVNENAKSGVDTFIKLNLIKDLLEDAKSYGLEIK